MRERSNMTKMEKLPRILLAGMNSGCGKTLSLIHI